MLSCGEISFLIMYFFLGKNKTLKTHSTTLYVHTFPPKQINFPILIPRSTLCYVSINLKKNLSLKIEIRLKEEGKKVYFFSRSFPTYFVFLNIISYKGTVQVKVEREKMIIRTKHYNKKQVNKTTMLVLQ